MEPVGTIRQHMPCTVFLVLVSILCHLQITVFCAGCGGRPNLALHKVATQSSTLAIDIAMTADLAVDGIRNGDMYGCYSCSHTRHLLSPVWWQVDLGQVFPIQEVVLSNRDRLADRLREFDIEVAKSVEDNEMMNPVTCAEVTEPQATGSTVSYTCQGGEIMGRFVRITKANSVVLTLCEVQVFGRFNDSTFEICEDTFSLYQKDVVPTVPAILSTTTSSVTSCAYRCLQTQYCTSFTVTTSGKELSQCQLFECKPGDLLSANGTSLYLLTRLVNDLQQRVEVRKRGSR